MTDTTPVELDKHELSWLLMAVDSLVSTLHEMRLPTVTPEHMTDWLRRVHGDGVAVAGRLREARMDLLTPEEFDAERDKNRADSEKLAEIIETIKTDVLADAERLRQEKLTGLRIDQLYAYVATDGDDDEGLPAANINGMAMPLIAADQARLVSLRPYAQETATVTGRPVRLVRFSERTVIETIEPG